MLPSFSLDGLWRSFLCTLQQCLSPTAWRRLPCDTHLRLLSNESQVADPPLSPSAPADSGRDALLHRVFDLFDLNGDRLVSAAEMRESLQKLGVRDVPDHEQLELLVNCASETAAEHLQLHEFKSLYECLSEEEPQQAAADGSSLLDAFRVFDVNGDGYICAAELQTVLSGMGFSECRDLSFCESIVSRVDSNSDGRIDLSEFQLMMSDLQSL